MAQPGSVLIKILFLQGGEETLRTDVVVAPIGALMLWRRLLQRRAAQKAWLVTVGVWKKAASKQLPRQAFSNA